MITFPVPNLDEAADEKECLQFEEALSLLIQFVRQKRFSLHYKENNSRNLSAKSQEEADKIFAKLPNWAKWERPL